MKPQVPEPRLSQPPARHKHDRVTVDAFADTPGVHVLLTRVRHGGLGWHRAGYVTLDDGLDPAPQMLDWHLTLLEAVGLVCREPYERDHMILLTRAGDELLDRLNCEMFGGAL